MAMVSLVSAMNAHIVVISIRLYVMILMRKFAMCVEKSLCQKQNVLNGNTNAMGY